MSGFLTQMLEMLTSAYTREDIKNTEAGNDPQTNIGKLFSVLSWGLDLAREQYSNIKAWDDLDLATGAVLDRYGLNFGVERDGADDDFYRLLIQIKMISLLSGGDIDTVVNATATMFDTEPTEIELVEDYPAKFDVYVNENAVPEGKLDVVGQIAEVLKRIKAAGVGMEVVMRKTMDYDGSMVLNTFLDLSSTVTIVPFPINVTYNAEVYFRGHAYTTSEVTINPVIQ